MGHAAKAREQERKARERLSVLHPYEQVTRNVSRAMPVLRGLPAVSFLLTGSDDQD
jgi:hypothetical protein